MPYPSPAAHAEGRRAGSSQRRGEVGELAEQRPRVARVDDLLDPEGLRRAEGRAELVQALLDLGELGRGIGGGVEIGAVGGLDPALERQRAPAARRPRVAQAVAAAVCVRGAGHAERVPDDDRAPRHRRLPDGRHRAHALLDRPRLLGLEPDEKAGAVDEVDHGQVEGLRDVDEALDLLAGVRRPRAAVVVRIARHQRHRPAVEAREPGDDRAAVERRRSRRTSPGRRPPRRSRASCTPCAGRAGSPRRATGRGAAGSSSRVRAAAGRRSTTASRRGSAARARRPLPPCRPRRRRRRP